MRAVAGLLVAFLVMLSAVTISLTVWHPAYEITSGTFPDSSYTFSGNLTVQGNLSVGQSLQVDSRINTSTLCLSDDCITAWDQTNNITGIGTTNYLAKWTSTSSLGTSVMYDDGTRVGIGTTNPARKFHVTSSTWNDGIRIGEAGSGLGRPHIEFQKDTGVNWSIVAGWGGNLLFKPDIATSDTTDSDAVLSMASGGKVGINVRNPTNALDVNGSAAIGSSYVGTSAPANGLIVEGNVGIGTPSPSGKLEVSGDILLSSVGNRLNLANTGYLEATTQDNIITLQADGTLDFKIADRVPLKVLYTDVNMYSNLHMYDNTIYGSESAGGNLTLESTTSTTKGSVLINPYGGNVGIGLSSPQAKLHVSGGDVIIEI